MKAGREINAQAICVGAAILNSGCLKQTATQRNSFQICPQMRTAYDDIRAMTSLATQQETDYLSQRTNARGEDLAGKASSEKVKE